MMKNKRRRSDPMHLFCRSLWLLLSDILRATLKQAIAPDTEVGQLAIVILYGAEFGKANLLTGVQAVVTGHGIGDSTAQGEQR